MDSDYIAQGGLAIRSVLPRHDENVRVVDLGAIGRYRFLIWFWVWLGSGAGAFGDFGDGFHSRCMGQGTESSILKKIAG